MERFTWRIVTLLIAFVIVLFGSNAQASSRLSAHCFVAVEHRVPDAGQIFDMGGESGSEDSDLSASTWMPEAETEHPMLHSEVAPSVALPIVLHGRGMHVYHAFASTHEPSPVTPPPDAV